MRSRPAWTPFAPATPLPVTEDQITGTMKTFPNLSRADVERHFAEIDKDVIFLNSRYQVNVRKHAEVVSAHWPAMFHLSIKRLDKDRVGPERYRDFMRIKDQLIGPENEAVELYPARSREVDTANQYHLWVLADEHATFPFGFNDGRVVTGDSSGGARQHPFEDD